MDQLKTYMSTNFFDILSINESRLDYTSNGEINIPLRGRIEVDQVEVLLFIEETQLTTNVSHIKRMILNFSLFKYLNLS